MFNEDIAITTTNATPRSNCISTPVVYILRIYIYIYILVEVLFNVGRKGAIVTFGGSRPGMDYFGAGSRG